MRQPILAIANNLLGRATSLNRILRGLMAWLVVLQLVSGMGIVRVMASTPETDSRYDAASLLAQSDVALDDFSIPGPITDDGSGDDDPIHGTAVVVANVDRPSVPSEGQIAFGLRSAVTRAIHPTGPPALS